MSTIDIEKLATHIRRKRGSMNLRDTAEAIGDVSISTLSRIDQGKIPDLSTFMKICQWLETSPEEFAPGFQKLDEEEQNHREAILYHLRADSSLSEDVAIALQKMIEVAYQNKLSTK